MIDNNVSVLDVGDSLRFVLPKKISETDVKLFARSINAYKLNTGKLGNVVLLVKKKLIDCSSYQIDKLPKGNSKW